MSNGNHTLSGINGDQIDPVRRTEETCTEITNPNRYDQPLNFEKIYQSIGINLTNSESILLFVIDYR